MKVTDISRGSRRWAGLVVAMSVMAVLASLLGGSARAATDAMAEMCPPAGALVTYASGGSMSVKSIVVQADGRVWVCWAGRNGPGRIGFVLSKPELTALRAQLSQTGVRHLGSAAGQQTTKAAAAAVHRAELMLDLAAEQRISGASGAQTPSAGAVALRRADLMIDLTAERLVAGE